MKKLLIFRQKGVDNLALHVQNTREEVEKIDSGHVPLGISCNRKCVFDGQTLQRQQRVNVWKQKKQE